MVTAAPTLTQRRRLRKWRILTAAREWEYAFQPDIETRVEPGDRDGDTRVRLSRAPGTRVYFAHITRATATGGAQTGTTRLASATTPEAKAEAEQLYFGAQTRVPCPFCREPLTGANSQWAAHMRTHAPGRRSPDRPVWQVVEPYWEWALPPDPADADGSRARLTRVKTAVNEPPAFQMEIVTGGGPAQTWFRGLDAVRVKDAQAEAGRLLEEFRAAYGRVGYAEGYQLR